MLAAEVYVPRVAPGPRLSSGRGVTGSTSASKNFQVSFAIPMRLARCAAVRPPDAGWAAAGCAAAGCAVATTPTVIAAALNRLAACTTLCRRGTRMNGLPGTTPSGRAYPPVRRWNRRAGQRSLDRFRALREQREARGQTGDQLGSLGGQQPYRSDAGAQAP